MIYNNPVVDLSLGTVAQSSSTREEIAPILATINDRDKAIAHRFKLQRRAQKLLPNERISQCMRKVNPGNNFVVGWHNPENGNAGLKNLVTCDSYSCPVCAAKRAEQDRREITAALAQAQKLGYFPVLITYTMSHRLGDKLDTLREGMNAVFQDTFKGSWYDNLRKEWGFVGVIKAWETMFGNNGFHPHIHGLYFLKYALSDAQSHALQEYIFSRYRGVLQKHGFYASDLHGVDVRTADSDIADYVAKYGKEPQNKAWGVDSEIAHSSSKKAAIGGLTPFQLLEAAEGHTAELERLGEIYHTKDTEKLKSIAGSLYCEYFTSFKGVARLYWSPGLAKLLDIENALAKIAEKTPDERAKDVEIVKIPVGRAWEKIKGNWNTPDLRAEFIALIRTGDKKLLRDWLLFYRIDHAFPSD